MSDPLARVCVGCTPPGATGPGDGSRPTYYGTACVALCSDCRALIGTPSVAPWLFVGLERLRVESTLRVEAIAAAHLVVGRRAARCLRASDAQIEVLSRSMDRHTTPTGLGNNLLGLLLEVLGPRRLLTSQQAGALIASRLAPGEYQDWVHVLLRAVCDPFELAEHVVRLSAVCYYLTPPLPVHSLHEAIEGAYAQMVRQMQHPIASVHVATATQVDQLASHQRARLEMHRRLRRARLAVRVGAVLLSMYTEVSLRPGHSLATRARDRFEALADPPAKQSRTA